MAREEGFSTEFDAGFFCERGDFKEANEDAILIKTCVFAGVGVGMFVVADGVGGMDYGDVASGISTGILANWWDVSLMEILSGKIEIEFILASLDGAISQANSAVITFARESGKNMGTTLTLLLLLGDLAFIRHIGDGRIYLFGKDTETPRMITEDHTYLAELLRDGRISMEEALNHPQRNAITKCIGSDICLTLFKSYEKVGAGDVFLLCTDGFYSLARENDISRIIKNDSTATASDKAAALRLLIGKGMAYDNLSLILVTRANELPL